MKTCGQMRCVSIILIISLLMTLAACSKSIDKFKKAVENNNSSDAIEIYNDKLSDDKEDQKEARNYIKKRLSDSLSDYGSGKITEKEFESIYKTIEKVNQKVNGISSIEDTYYKYQEVKASKESFKAGEKAYSEKDYATAVRQYSLIISDDTEHYKDAQQKLQDSIKNYESSVLDQVDKSVASGNYDEAFLVIDNAIDDIGTEKLKDYREGLVDSYESYAIETAQQLANEGKYQEAYQCLNDAIDTIGYTDKLSSTYSSIYIEEYETKMKTAYDAKDYLSVFRIYVEADWIIEGSSEMMNYYTSSITEYLNDIDVKAESAFGDNKDYEAAILVLRDALSDVVDLNILEITSHIEEKIAYYQEYQPIYLTDLSCIQKNNVEIGEEVDTSDVNKRNYTAETVIRQSMSKNDNKGYVLYNINFEYSSLRGVLYRPHYSLSCDYIWSQPGCVKIYGDDVLLYESPKVTQDFYDALEFDIDIHGVRNLKIEFSNSVWAPGGTIVWDYGSDGWVNNEEPKVCIADCELQK